MRIPGTNLENNSSTVASPRILIADDQHDVLEALRLLLKGEGYQIDTADSPAGVIKALERREYDVLLIDLNYARDTTTGAPRPMGTRGAAMADTIGESRG